MRSALSLVLLLYAATTSIAGVSTNHSHPLHGKWEIFLPDERCSEVYDFRPNGTRVHTSAEESGQSAYTISKTPSLGFNELEDRITHSNGKSDCSGGSSPVGSKAILYIRFNSNLDQMIMCRDPSLANCFGPFMRLPDSRPAGPKTGIE